MGMTISLPHPAGAETVAFILLGNIEIGGGGAVQSMYIHEEGIEKVTRFGRALDMTLRYNRF